MSKENIDYRLETVKMVEKLHKTIYNQDQKISDLEAKLAESEEQVKIVEKQHSELLMTIFDGHKENFELKQQLAEVKNSCDYYMNRANDLLLKDQDKISFAVEQLEKVKEELEFTSNNNEWITTRDDRILNGICDFIDNQIKQLKEGQ